MRRSVPHPAVVVAVLALVAAVLAVGGGTAGAAVRGTVQPADDGTVRLKVQSQNIFYGGDDLDLTTGDWCPVADGCPATLRAVEAMVRTTGADVVGLQEAERNAGRIARALGWYASDRAHVISRFPIIDPADGDGVYVFVLPRPGRVVAVANVHLPSDPYGPFLVRDGGTAAQLAALERRTRLPAVQRQLEVLPRLAARGIPVFLTGDFNSPSHLDWTAAVDAVRTDVRYPFAWPVSKALADAGLRDSYREAHPDPVAAPGFTWTPGSPEADAHEVFDRIDWVLHAGPGRTVASTVVGEKGGADVGIGFRPWVSDHRGVLSTFDVRPAPAPLLVGVSSRRVFAGDPLTVTFHAPGRAGERVALVRHGGGAATAVASAATGAGAPRDGTAVLATAAVPAGPYDAVLLSAGGTVLARSTLVQVYPAGAGPTIRTDRRAYAVGEPIGFAWAAAPGMALDWVGVFRCYPGGCAGNGGYLLYTYTGTAVEGRGVLGPGPATFDGYGSWPLPPGQYVVRLLTDDGYVSVAASARFRVWPAAG